jgi:hypothetical protein
MSQPASEPDWSVYQPPEEESPEEEYFREQAIFCLATGVQPSEYDQMTRVQLSAWINVLNERK